MTYWPYLSNQHKVSTLLYLSKYFEDATKVLQRFYFLLEFKLTSGPQSTRCDKLINIGTNLHKFTYNRQYLEKIEQKLQGGSF